MTRRKKPSGLENRKLTNEDFQRGSDNIDQRESVLIALEDTESSVVYFKLILNDLKLDKKITPFSCAFANHTSTHPTGVLKDLLNHSPTGGTTYRDFDHLWIVIDRDYRWRADEGHGEADFKKALSDAASYDVNVAYSNDSFELWYLLHFDHVCAVTPRADLNAKVKSLGLVDPKHSLKSREFVTSIYPALVKNECTAIRNAQRLLKTHVENDVHASDANPSTTVHKLVCLLRKLGRKCEKIDKCEDCNSDCDCICHKVHCTCEQEL